MYIICISAYIRTLPVKFFVRKTRFLEPYAIKFSLNSLFVHYWVQGLSIHYNWISEPYRQKLFALLVLLNVYFYMFKDGFTIRPVLGCIGIAGDMDGLAMAEDLYFWSVFRYFSKWAVEMKSVEFSAIDMHWFCASRFFVSPSPSLTRIERIIQRLIFDSGRWGFLLFFYMPKKDTCNVPTNTIQVIKLTVATKQNNQTS